MEAIADYQARADQERMIAGEATLPRIREQHLRAASRWEFLADEAIALSQGFNALFNERKTKFN